MCVSASSTTGDSTGDSHPSGLTRIGPDARLVSVESTATLAIFLPAFLFVAGCGPLIPRIRRSAIAGGFFDGVNAASLALMLVVTIQLSKTALVDATTLILLIASLTALIAFHLNSVWLVMGGLAIGYLFH